MSNDDAIINPRQGNKAPKMESYEKFINSLPAAPSATHTSKENECLETLREGLKRMKYANLYSGAGGQLKNLIKNSFPFIILRINSLLLDDFVIIKSV